jgi:hypothetical protein
MRLYLLLTTILLLTACSSSPKELLAPCDWDHRSHCGKVVAMSHQDQL